MVLTIEYENFNALFNITRAVTLAPLNGAIWSTSVLATIAISKSPCSDFMNLNIGACASDQNRSSMENELIFFYYCILMK